MEILGKLFGSEARVRVLRLFFLSPDTGFDTRDVAIKTKTKSTLVRKELSLLFSIGVIKRHGFYKEVGGKKKKIIGWSFDKTFHHRGELKDLLVSTDLVKKNEILSRFKHAGNVKLLIIAGIFIKSDSSRIDIFIVGDKLKRGVIDNIIRSLEAEAGKELRYSVLDTAEFRYRLDVYDKFVRDILDYPNEVVVDKLGVRSKEN